MAKQGGSQDDDSALVIFVAFIVLFLVFMSEIHWLFAEAWRWLRVASFSLFAWVPDTVPYIGDIGKTRDILMELPADKLTPKVQDMIDGQFARFYSILGALIMGFLSIGLLKKTNFATKRFDIESLLEHFSSKFKFQKTMLKTHPELENIQYTGKNAGTASSLSPWRFATETDKMVKGCKRPIYIHETKVFDAELARKVFDRQLGKPWTGKEKMSNTERWAYEQMLTRIPEKDAQKVMRRHAFIRTGLMSLLEECRKGGEFASLRFREIKGKDRTLWYTLSSVGRRTPFTECAGVYAHWMMEKHVDRALTRPETTEAVEALAESIGVEPEDVRGA